MIFDPSRARPCRRCTRPVYWSATVIAWVHDGGAAWCAGGTHRGVPADFVETVPAAEVAAGGRPQHFIGHTPVIAWVQRSPFCDWHPEPLRASMTTVGAIGAGGECFTRCGADFARLTPAAVNRV